MCSIFLWVKYHHKSLNKKNDVNTILSFPWFIHFIKYHFNFFLYKSTSVISWLRFSKSLFCKLNQIYKNHRQNTLHAWGDIKILLLEMKVQLGNVALNIWKWRFLTRLLLIKQGIMQDKDTFKSDSFYSVISKGLEKIFYHIKVYQI